MLAPVLALLVQAPPPDALTLSVEPFADEDGFRVVHAIAHEGSRRVRVVTKVRSDPEPASLQLPDGLGDEAWLLRFPAREEAFDVGVRFELEGGAVLEDRVTVEPERLPPWREVVRSSLDVLLEHGRDRYGEVESPLFMAVLDVDLRVSPEEPLLLDSVVRLEPGRLHRRAERGANVWYDQALLRALRRMTYLADDPRYGAAADDCVAYFLEHCAKPEEEGVRWATGLPAWGTHVYWDCYEDRPGGDGDGLGPHEILVYVADWPQLFAHDPARALEIAEGVWRWHVVDEETGVHNRHDDDRLGCDFAFSGGTFVHLFASTYAATGDAVWLDRARTVADWHLRHRDEETGLVPDAPSTGTRYDATHMMTCVTGPHVAQLLAAYEASGERHFYSLARAYQLAYDAHAWDEDLGTYLGMVAIDGTPVMERPSTDLEDYGAYMPAGAVDVWRTTLYSYEFPLVSAQAAVWAYERSGPEGDPALLRVAERWGEVLLANLPPTNGRRWSGHLEAHVPRVSRVGGTYAENYGRAISFLVHLARATGQPRWFEAAEDLAEEAVRKLYRNGLLRGHPAKPYYETTNGVGLLLWALLELDARDEALPGAF